MEDKNFLVDVCQKLNVHKGNFVAYCGNGQSEYLFPDILESIGGVVVSEYNNKARATLKSDPKMKNVRFVDSAVELDESAFDRVMCFYWEGLFYPTPEPILNKMIECGDNKCLVCVSGIPDAQNKKSNGILRFKRESFEDYFESRGIVDYWFVSRPQEEKFDIIFRVIK